MGTITSIIFALTLIFSPKASAQEASIDPSKIYYFYNPGCGHCANVEKYFNEKEIYQKYPIVKINTQNRAGATLFNHMYDRYDVPLNRRGVPTIFFGDKFFMVGDTPIIKNFETAATEFLQPAETSKNDQQPQENQQGDQQPTEKPDLTTLAVVGGALVDSINPCAFAVLILLLTAILTSGSGKRALKAGFLFATSIFLSYLAMGLGLYKALSIGSLPHYFMKGIGILAIILGLFNLKDYFKYGWGGFMMEVPMSWRPKMKSIIARVTSPLGAFAIGFVISLFLLPCTSGPYIVVLGMLSQKTLFAKALVYLILYNLIFIAPMIIITVAVYKGLDVKKAEEARQGRLRALHLIAGLLLIGMGIIVLMGWV